MNVYVHGDLLKGAVECNPSTLEVSLSPHYCISYEEQLNTTVVGTCPYTEVLNLLASNFQRIYQNSYVVQDIERISFVVSVRTTTLSQSTPTT